MHESLRLLIELANTLKGVLAGNLETTKTTVAAMEDLVAKVGGASDVLRQLKSDVGEIAASYEVILAELTAGDMTEEQEKAVFDRLAEATKKLSDLTK